MNGGIDILIIARGIKEKKQPKESDNIAEFRNMVMSLHSNAVSKPLHLILLSDHASIVTINNILIESRVPFYLKGHLMTMSKHTNYQTMPLHIDFLDVEELIGQIEIIASPMKRFFSNPPDNTMEILNENNVTQKFRVDGKKYEDTMNFLFPFYHLLLPSINQLIVLDFDTVDPSKLHEEFIKFDGSNLLGLGVDLSIQYHHRLSRYRKENPGTLVGMPGRYQGLNGGVILMDLNKIRQSKLYKHFLSEGGIKEMVDKFKFYNGFLAGQDWVTLMSLAAPHLIYPLSCMFNRQIGLPSRVLWKLNKDFYSCEDFAQDAYVLHGASRASISRWDTIKSLLQRQMNEAGESKNAEEEMWEYFLSVL